MNKVFSLFMICAMAVSLTAADTLFFNRYQFQPALGVFETGDAANKVKDLAAITVPFVYSGNLKLTGYGATDNDWINYEKADADCVVGSNTLNVPAYMTICQPCLDCYPCAVLGQENNLRVLDNQAKVGKDAAGLKALVGSVTRWNLYVVQKIKYDKKEYVQVQKVNLLTNLTAADYKKSVFFTGRKGSGNDSYAFAQYKGFDDKHKDTMMFTMIGKKNDYKFKYTVAKLATNGTWTVVKESGKEVTDTAYIKSATKFDGVFCAGRMYGSKYQDFIVTTPAYPDAYNQDTKITADKTNKIQGFQYCGEIKLTRNASLTGTAIKGTFGVTKPKAVSNWEDCDEDIPATYCEQYFSAGEWGDKMDQYLMDNVYKSYVKDDRFDYELDDLVDLLLGEEWENEDWPVKDPNEPSM